MSRSRALKPVPAFKTDAELEAWFDTADFSEYDLSALRPIEFRFKDARVNMRLPAPLLQRLKIVAAEEGVPYQRLMRDLMVSGLIERGRKLAATAKKKAS
jgi:predicted DNA binding CopG/RHH family protein